MESAEQMWPSTRTPAEEEPEDPLIEQAEVEDFATLPLMIERLPDPALLEAATVPRHPRKPSAPGQLSLF